MLKEQKIEIATLTELLTKQGTQMTALQKQIETSRSTYSEEIETPEEEPSFL